MHHDSVDPLALDAEEMRRIGYRTVDMLVRRILDEGPANVRIRADELTDRIAGPPPEEPLGYDAALDWLERDVLPYAMRNDHPGFLGFIPTSPTWPGALADLIGAALAIDASSWAEAAGPSAVEVEVLRWFAEWIGFPPESDGVLVSGGSAANLTALACARERVPSNVWRNAIGYVSDQSHSSIPRAARALGFLPDQVRVLPADRDLRLSGATLARAVARDREQGLIPLFAVANAGATSTGSIDRLHELAEVCAEHDVWLHVDAAYGGFAALTERGRAALAGLERADSVTLDPHKWLYQPWECGALLVRRPQALRHAFGLLPAYLASTAAQPGETNFGELGLQLSRSPRALKVWLSLATFGLRAFRRAIDRSLDLADLVRERVAEHPNLSIVAPPSLSVTCIRRTFPEASDAQDEDRLNCAIAAEVERSGIGLVTTTRVEGRIAIRLCVLCHTTTPEHVRAVVDLIASGSVTADQARSALHEDDPWFHASADPDARADGGVDVELLRGLPVLADASDETLRRIARIARRLLVGPEVAIVVAGEQDGAGDFFLVAGGTLRVELDGVVVRQLGPGEFFGELGALDWGAGYGYPRSATVVSEGPAELIVLPDRTLELAMRIVPRLDREVRARFFERLHRR